MQEELSSMISENIVSAIRRSAAEGEKNKQLPQSTLGLIYENNWFNLFVPKGYGGLGLTLPEALRLEESIAWADGSTGWTVTLCSGANYFIGFLEEPARKGLFADGHVCFAGSGYASGLAIKTDKGYKIKGRWRYATGAPHATVFTAVCHIQENGRLVTDTSGKPLAEAFWFPANEVRVHNDWQGMGMIATASNSFEVRDLEVLHENRFVIDAAHAQLRDAIFQYPFLPFAQLTLSAGMLGMATRFRELCMEAAGEKSSLVVASSEAGREIAAARRKYFGEAERSWEELVTNGRLSQSTIKNVGDACAGLIECCRNVVNRLYPHCGIAAAITTTELNRVWRNFQTAGQHTLFRAMVAEQPR